MFGGEGSVFAEGPPPLSPNKYSFQGSPTGLPATYDDVFGAPPNDETQLMRFIPGSSDIAFGKARYRFYYYKDGVWTPETPVLNSLEPAFVIYPYLSIKYTVSGNPPTIDMTWPARGELEEADSPLGTWHAVTTAGNHHSVTIDPAQGQGKYYRVREGGL